MKKSYKNIYILLVITFALTISANYITSFGEESDPLVTQSYVEMRLEQIMKYIEQKVSVSNNSESQTSVESLEKYIRFVPIQLKLGDRLIGGEGSEIVLRAGDARSIGSNDGGLLNVSEGLDIPGNQNIPKNHLLIVPRDDERGIRITSAEAYVMVKGPYEVK